MGGRRGGVTLDNLAFWKGICHGEGLLSLPETPSGIMPAENRRVDSDDNFMNAPKESTRCIANRSVSLSRADR